MILYHLDRSNSFPYDHKSQLIHPIATVNTVEANKLFNSIYTKGFSYTGIRYASPFDVKLSNYEDAISTYENSRIFTIEYVFEMVRLLYFNDLPSRLTSLFSCQTIQDVKKWYNTLSQNNKITSQATIKKIETNNKIFIGDSFWRDDKFHIGNDQHQIFSPFAYHEWARKYWNGIISPHPSIEVLCELPVTVLESIPVSEVFDVT